MPATFGQREFGSDAQLLRAAIGNEENNGRIAFDLVPHSEGKVFEQHSPEGSEHDSRAFGRVADEFQSRAIVLKKTFPQTRYLDSRTIRKPAPDHRQFGGDKRVDISLSPAQTFL